MQFHLNGYKPGNIPRVFVAGGACQTHHRGQRNARPKHHVLPLEAHLELATFFDTFMTQSSV